MPRSIKGMLAGLVVKADNRMVKIEPNAVIRGTLFEPVTLSVKGRVEDLFGLSVRARTLVAAEIYGGKICAALDRQHPRDLFDIKLLLQDDGVTDSIRKCFIVHLVSHDRPMAELLDPNFVDLRKTFINELQGMTFIKVTPEELEAVREGLVKIIREGITDKEREFIFSVKKGEPAWDLIELDGVDRLPAIQWKLINIGRMDRKKHKMARNRLEACLSR